MILFDPIALAETLRTGTEALRASVDAPATLLQVERGALSVSVAAGLSDYGSNSPAAPEQTFEIGSQTKLMTAVAVLQLVEAGLVDLDAPAATYLPAAVIEGIANADTATVRQLLNMTSGIDNYTEVRDAEGVPLFIRALLENPDQVFGPEQALDLARGLPALADPGAEYVYSNTNYTLLGQIIENLTGRAFFDVLQDGIFAPAGMDDTVRQLGTDDPRLSSYLADETGTLVDVTRAPWEMRGEAGIASTTTDMIAFLNALFVDRTLLGEAALAEMMQFIPTGANETLDTGFGLGLVRFAFVGGDTYLGFTGGTLGTASSTYLNIDTGNLIAVAGTSADLDTVEASFPLLQDLDGLPRFNLVDDGSMLRFVSGSAGALTLTATAEGLAFGLGGATLTLARDLRDTTTETVTFADGSVLVVGDNATGAGADDRANSIDILRGFGAAAEADNHLIGLGGDDPLRAGNGDDLVQGGAGDDRLEGRRGDDLLRGGSGEDSLIGGAGEDRLAGGSGDDRVHGGQGNDRLEGRRDDDLLSGGAGQDSLSGGDGRDRLTGGAGQDQLWGGTGADLFVFRTAQDSAVGRHSDIIRDFEQGIDRIDLAGLAGEAGGALGWVGDGSFTGSGRELRFGQEGDDLRLSLDLNADGVSDMDILLQGTATLSLADVLM